MRHANQKRAREGTTIINLYNSGEGLRKQALRKQAGRDHSGVSETTGRPIGKNARKKLKMEKEGGMPGFRERGR